MNTDNLSHFLTLQLNAIEQLQQVLNVEKQALIDRDHEKIEILAQQKQQLLVSLNEADQQLAQLLDSQPLPQQLQPIKLKITAIVEHCHEQNQQNGRAIDLSINSLNRLQRSLIQKRAGNAMTYNAKGKTRGTGSSSGYVSA